MMQRLRYFLVIFTILLVLGAALPARAQSQTHTVQPGETLFRIALRYGVTVEALVAANNLPDASRIYVGQVLVIPPATIPSASGNGALPVTNVNPNPATIIHTVQPGQTLNMIAQQYGVSVQAIMSANNLPDMNHIEVGQRLVIPGTKSGDSGTLPGLPSLPPAPTTAPTLMPQVAANYKTHVVQPGQGLASIARLYGIDWQLLASLNGISDPDRIFSGTVLKIPIADSSAGIPGPVTSSVANPVTGATSAGKYIKVVLHEQRVYMFENNQLVRNVLVSTGMAGTPTVIGDFKIYVKYPAQLMYGPGYYLPGVPWVMYFYQGYGLHGTYWHHNWGTPMSHGCVNMPTDEAQWLYSWAPVGTPVTVVW